MKYQVQENCLTIYLPCEVDDHNADENGLYGQFGNRGNHGKI